jgi:death-on-curing protein
MALVYITIEQAIEIHANTVDVSGGGTHGILDKGRLESVLEHIKNDDYYPEFLDKITHLFFCANKFHCFQDGNKRIAITISAQFLLNNGYMYCVRDFMHQMENVSYHLAAGKIDKDLLRDLIEAIINKTIDEDEGLKLRLLQAIQTEL